MKKEILKHIYNLLNATYMKKALKLGYIKYIISHTEYLLNSYIVRKNIRRKEF